jgi:hypothetical protein
MLAYVFWHWKRSDVPALAYEQRQYQFHAALAADPPRGFLGSFSAHISGAPWAADAHEAYEDWYWVADFAALDWLNQAAVSGSRTASHDQAARVAAGGTAGLYKLRLGGAPFLPNCSYWFRKPDALSYDELFALISPIVDGGDCALWMRQMTLGPATEFCLQATALVALPSVLEALRLPMRIVSPGSSHLVATHHSAREPRDATVS